jgi:hypothetical protein
MLLNRTVTFVTGTLAASLVLAGLPAFAQISNGTRNPAPAGDQSALIAAAKAEFPSVLAKALSSESIAAMLQQIKVAPNSTPGVTNFDDVTAPCDFVDTTALRGTEQSAYFQAPGTDGGGILNECSDFGGIDAHSPPNFLAFNNATTYTSGGVPRTPELILVGPNRSSVSLWVSGGGTPGYPLAVAALSPGGVQGIVTTVTTSQWVQLTIAGTGISAIALVGNPQVLLVDDIQAQ